MKPNLPPEPPPGLLYSMALRLHHDFGIDKVEGEVNFCGFTPREREVVLQDMRRLYEEVSGHGFFNWENVTEPDRG